MSDDEHRPSGLCYYCDENAHLVVSDKFAFCTVFHMQKLLGDARWVLNPEMNGLRRVDAIRHPFYGDETWQEKKK